MDFFFDREDKVIDACLKLLGFVRVGNISRHIKVLISGVARNVVRKGGNCTYLQSPFCHYALKSTE